MSSGAVANHDCVKKGGRATEGVEKASKAAGRASEAAKRDTRAVERASEAAGKASEAAERVGDGDKEKQNNGEFP